MALCCVEATGQAAPSIPIPRSYDRTPATSPSSYASALRRRGLSLVACIHLSRMERRVDQGARHLFDGMLTMPTASDKDRFSDLTDDLLKHVLSFLPPDEALQTCVLDTRWRDLWRRTTSLVLIFEDETLVEKGASVPAQCAFVQGRSIHENYKLVANTAKFLHRKKSQAVLMKIDISKAFGTVSWEFLLEGLLLTGLSSAVNLELIAVPKMMGFEMLSHLLQIKDCYSTSGLLLLT
ncbi:hypothetical protein ACQ4PT_018073 [Festuca glaucescens]